MYQEVMRNSNLSAEAKAIYAYLSSIAGVGGICYPSLNTIQKDMAMSRNRISKYLTQLIQMGIVEKTRERTATGFGTNVYKVTHEAKISEELQDIFRAIESEHDTVVVENVALQNVALGSKALESEAIQNIDTNNNNININNININNINNNNIDYQQIATLYNSICVSFPKLTKLSDRRKKSIRARFNQGYTVEDFKRLFELAEGSRFLKGGNDRNWSASFDWMIADANIAKVLDGNYTDKKGGIVNADNSGKDRGQASNYYRRYFEGSESD